MNSHSGPQAENWNINQTTQFDYFMDNENLLVVGEDHIEAQFCPDNGPAQILSQAFFHALHGIFDCFNREAFLKELHSFPRGQQSLSCNWRRWLALANLMWAIGSKWLHLAKLDDTGEIESHLVYYARARALRDDHRGMLEHDILHDVKMDGLLAFYLYLNGSVTG